MLLATKRRLPFLGDLPGEGRLAAPPASFSDDDDSSSGSGISSDDDDFAPRSAASSEHAAAGIRLGREDLREKRLRATMFTQDLGTNMSNVSQSLLLVAVNRARERFNNMDKSSSPPLDGSSVNGEKSLFRLG